MSGSLVLVDEFTVSSGVANVIIGGGSSGSSGLNASIDSTYDVYILNINNLVPDVAENLECRVTEGGIAQSSANYYYRGKGMKTTGSFDNNTGSAVTQFDISGSQIHATTGNFNATMYIMNASNSSAYTGINFETSQYTASGILYGNKGHGMFKSASSVDGLLFQIDNSNNIEAGSRFVLYGLKK